MSFSINSVFFIIFSSLLIFLSICAIISKKMVYTLLWAMLTFLMVGCLFLLLGATYNAMAQFLIYVVAIPILVAVSIMLMNQNTVHKRFIRGRYMLFTLLGVFSLVLIIGEFLSLNTDIFEIVKTCIIYVNPYSDLISISKNILGVYPVLLLEFGLGLLVIVIGLSHYEK